MIIITKLFPDYFYLRFKKNRPTRQDKPKTVGGTIADNHKKLFQSQEEQTATLDAPDDARRGGKARMGTESTAVQLWVRGDILLDEWLDKSQLPRLQ